MKIISVVVIDCSAIAQLLLPCEQAPPHRTRTAAHTPNLCACDGEECRLMAVACDASDCTDEPIIAPARQCT